MIQNIEFTNFKALKNASLELGPFALIVGPNGSGKSTVFQGLQAAADPGRFLYGSVATAGSAGQVRIGIKWHEFPHFTTDATWHSGPGGAGPRHLDATGNVVSSGAVSSLNKHLRGVQVFSWDAQQIASSVQLVPGLRLGPSGQNLAGVLDDLRDRFPERFEALNSELARWIPEFDRILFETPKTGHRAFLLRPKGSQHRIGASDLSQGTLIALAILTLAYLPEPPPIVCFEEPDRGIHPRLLRDIRDALYRLSHPADSGESRQPVQVLVTTHSPVFLDLYRDHPDEIVIAQKEGLSATFTRLTDIPDYEEIIEGAHLGEVWYSGILGGAPLK